MRGGYRNVRDEIIIRINIYIMSLESQDGFVENLYPYLWLTDPLE